VRNNFQPGDNNKTEWLTPLKRDGLITLFCTIAQISYLAIAWLGEGVRGFPLDDAWIYQTYARNLATRGEWAFIPGLPSTGSTSILWTPLLVPGFWLPLSPWLWTQLVGLATLIAVSLGAARLFEVKQFTHSLLIGGAVALEWHLVWAAASGMETGLFAALIVWFWIWFRRNQQDILAHRSQNGLILGVWGGLLMLARPEGVLALAVAGVFGMAQSGQWTDRLRWGILAGVGFTLFLIPFFGLNLSVSGEFWPNTFYAKQTEYAVLWNQPLLVRLWQQASVMWVGAGIVALPGLLAVLWVEVRRRPISINWFFMPLLWVLLHWGVYAARLPVTYQHGRYAIPTAGILTAYAIVGVLRTMDSFPDHRTLRLLSLTWGITLATLFPAFLIILGAPAYGADVRFIEQEMVPAARWLSANTGTNQIIAAHDIGAIGYFSPRPLLDLAGLVSPEVIPFMLDEVRLADFVVSADASYLIVFPGWSAAYQRLVADPTFCVIWTAEDEPGYPGNEGLGPMTIYGIEPNGTCPNIP
jgi:hypothetical protein